VKQLSETEQQVVAEIETLNKSEIELANRIKEAEARLPGHQEAVRQAEAQAQRRADEELQRLSQLEAICEQAEADAKLRKQKEQSLNSKLESLSDEKESPVAVSSEIEVVDDQLFLSEPLPTEADKPEGNSGVEAGELPWLSIDLERSDKGNSNSKEIEFITAETTADLAVFEPYTPDEDLGDASVDPAPVFRVEPTTPLNGQDTSLPQDIVERLQSANSSHRAAALADLADIKGADSFDLITKSFDDPSVEVRNAAARALYHLNPDLSASFTHALREASPERRRKIGAAIAASGLATNAINSLAGEGLDRTYDAFSILFLMAKAGEVQPLLQAIGRHADQEVRLTAVKLLALSNQPQILPALRNLAARESLPADVHAAVMEAIYVLSNPVREVA
jgi:hypothetical protein